jgi:hypothetical protein
MMQPPKMLDNKSNGTVSDELKANLQGGSKLSVISAYFTIYAFNELRKELSKIISVIIRPPRIGLPGISG